MNLFRKKSKQLNIFLTIALLFTVILSLFVVKPITVCGYDVKTADAEIDARNVIEQFDNDFLFVNAFVSSRIVEAIPEEASIVEFDNYYDKISNYLWYVDFSNGGSVSVFHKRGTEGSSLFISGGWPIQESYNISISYYGRVYGVYNIGLYGEILPTYQPNCIIEIDTNLANPVEIFSVEGSANVYAVKKNIEPEPPVVPESSVVFKESIFKKIADFFVNLWYWIKNAVVGLFR